jgi:hypothetical protein
MVFSLLNIFFMNTKITLILLFVLSYTNVYSQICGSDYYKYQLSQNKELQLLQEHYKYQYLLEIDKGTNRVEGVEIKIPVVFHVLYNPNHTIGQGSNLSKAKIDEQLAIINRGFAGDMKKGTPNSSITFCLAKVNPYFLPTNGIIRTATNENLIPTSLDDLYNNKDVKIKTLSKAWNPKKYLNIWVVNIDGYAYSYASFPPGGVYGIGQHLFDSENPLGGDGLVLDYRFVGNGNTITNQGKTAIHEIGHYLGLWHIWNTQPEQRNSCVEADCRFFGDEVCDTPPTNGGRLGEQFTTNECDSALTCDNNAFTRKIISAQNFMGYHSNDGCLKEFTEGQIVRMWYYIKYVRKEFWPISGGRPEDCTSCVACSVVPPKIKGDSLSCEGDINTYKIDAAVPYGCAVTWAVIGGSFVDYNNTIAPVTLPFGSPIFADSIRVKWDNSNSTHRISCTVFNCENLEGIAFSPTVHKEVQMKPFKPISFKQNPIEISCYDPETRVFINGAGMSRFQWLLPAGMTLQNAMPNTTNITDVPEALIQFANSTVVGEVKVKPLSTACNQDYISANVVRRAIPPTVPTDTKIFCKTAGQDKQLISIVGNYPNASGFTWSLPAGFINLGADGQGNNLNASQIWVQVQNSATDGHHNFSVYALTPCGDSYSAVIKVWVGLPVNTQLRLDTSVPTCGSYQTYYVTYQGGSLPADWGVTWSLTDISFYGGSAITPLAQTPIGIVSTQGNSVVLYLSPRHPAAWARLKASIRNTCGEIVHETVVRRMSCTYETNTFDTIIESFKTDSLTKTTFFAKNLPYQVWLDKAIYQAGEQIQVKILGSKLAIEQKPLAYLIDSHNFLASPIDTLRKVQGTGNLFVGTAKLPIYSKLRAGNYAVKITLDTSFVLLPITITDFQPIISASDTQKDVKQTSLLAPNLPQASTLAPNQPNPFSESTILRYFLPKHEQGILVIRNLLGAVVYQTEVVGIENTWQELELYTTAWRSGVYFCSLQTSQSIQTQKMVVSK